MATLAEKRAQRAAKQEAEIKLQENSDSYQDFILDKEDIELAITKLDPIINRVNAMKDIKTNTGDTYSVNCYALPSSIFGHVMDKILGLVSVTGAMFTEERQKEFQAITGVSYISWSLAANAMGRPAYFSKGQYNPAIPYNSSDLNQAIISILIDLKLPLSNLKYIQSNYMDAYFDNRSAKAKAQAEDFEKSALLDATSQFTIED